MQTKKLSLNGSEIFFCAFQIHILRIFWFFLTKTILAVNKGKSIVTYFLFLLLLLTFLVFCFVFTFMGGRERGHLRCAFCCAHSVFSCCRTAVIQWALPYRGQEAAACRRDDSALVTSSFREWSKNWITGDTSKKIIRFLSLKTLVYIYSNFALLTSQCVHLQHDGFRGLWWHGGQLEVKVLLLGTMQQSLAQVR